MNGFSSPSRVAAALAIAGLVLGPASAGAVPAEASGMTQAEADLVLEGVIVATSPSDSVALVRRAGAPRARVLRIGQEMEGYLLVDVTTSSARFQGGEGGLELFLTGGRGEPGPPTASAKPDRASKSVSPSVEDGWIRRTIPRASAKERLSKEIPVILKETDVAPRVEDGEVTGLRVSRLPDGTLLAESGLLPGDVLISINGEPLRQVGSLWELLSRLLDKDEIRVVVRRKGEVLKLAYDFTN
jgi:general secretion pathway protein C